MRNKRTALAIFIFPTVFLLAGCANSRNSEARSASDIFFDTAEALIGMFETDELTSQRNRELETAQRRRNWQRENLSDSELRQLGVDR